MIYTLEYKGCRFSKEIKLETFRSKPYSNFEDFVLDDVLSDVGENKLELGLACRLVKIVNDINTNVVEAFFEVSELPSAYNKSNINEFKNLLKENKWTHLNNLVCIN